MWTLTLVRIRLALRNRAFIFFSVVMPLAFLFLYAFVFAGSVPERVAYMLPAVLALTVMGSFWGLSMQLVIFREQGILRRFRLTPLGPASMLGSSILSNYFLTIPTVLIELAIADWYFRVPTLGNLWGVFVMVSLGMITFSSVGLIVASVTNSMQETQVINNAIWFPLLFLSGATVPFPMLPRWIQGVGLFLPATHLVFGLQIVMLGGDSVLETWPEVVALAGGTAFAFFVSTKLFRWEPEEKVTRSAKAWAVAAVIPFLLLGAWQNASGYRLAQARAIFQGIQSQTQPAPPTQPPSPQPEQPK
ncbi:MAG: ABC transporter permease [Candidatus Acidiferrales bacterium]